MSRRPEGVGPCTHDYAGPKRGWGHDYTFTPDCGGLWGQMTGWGVGIEKGDFLLLDNRGRVTRYRIEEISYCADPGDMWMARVAFAPRQAGDPDE